VFDHRPGCNDLVVQVYERSGPDRDRLIAARLSGAAQRHARWGGLTEDERAAGAVELREIGGG
jgi:hypothetical protein